MAKASDNKFPKLIITEGSAPSNADTGDQKLYIDSADHHIKLKNSSGSVTDLQAWKVIQEVHIAPTASATGTTVLPMDDTIPAKTEGDEFMTLAITPISASSYLDIDVTIQWSCSAVNYVSWALFRDTTTNAIAAISDIERAANDPHIAHLYCRVAASATTTTTFKLRGGVNGAGDTLTFNGRSGGRLFGGIPVTTMTITEVLP